MDDDVDAVLEWMGFDVEADRVVVADEAGLLNLGSFAHLDKTGVTALTESLRKRVPEDTRVHVSKGKQDMLLNAANWVGDFLRTSRDPVIPVNEAGEPDQELFEEALLLAKSRSEARKYKKDNSKTLSEAAEPNKLKEDKDWYEFSDQFFIYLSAIPGVMGVPLSYVIRAQAEPDDDREWEDDEFEEQMIARAPLAGPAFVTDAQSVHMLIWTFLETEELQSIIKPQKRRKNGRLDYLALSDYMRGAGNVSRRIGTAKQIRQTLHYRNERAMKFPVFMTRLRHMHRVFEEAGRPLTEDEKIEDLLEKIKADFLRAQKANLESMYNTGNLTFEQACNILASVVANSSEAKLQSRISSLKRGGGDGGGGGGGVKLKRLRGGGIDVDYEYSEKEYRQLENHDKNALRLARNKAGKTRKGAKGGGGGGDKDTVRLSQVETLLNKLVDKITPANSEEKKDTDEEPTPGNAGAQFGGRSEKGRKNKEKE